MKKLIIILFILISAISIAQQKDSNDYFTIGIYTGNKQISIFNEYTDFVPSNDGLNNIGIELEYFKFTDISFFSFWQYQFYKQYSYYSSPNMTNIKEAQNYGYSFDVGARYYLRKKIFNPYLQLAINSTTKHRGEYSYTYYSSYDSTYYTVNEKAYNEIWFTANLSAGLNIILYKNLLFDFRFNFYKKIDTDRNTNDKFWYTVIGGLKYSF